MTPFSLDIENFRSCYPGLTEEVISDAELVNLWGVINVLLGDGKGSFKYPVPVNQTILYAALCHLATLETNDMGQPGRIASATEGSVSVSFENISTNLYSAQWWSQTKCGALFWMMTQRYRVGCKLYVGSNYHPWG